MFSKLLVIQTSNSSLCPCQSWSYLSWRRCSSSPTGSLQSPRWSRTPQSGGRRGRFLTCAASIWTRLSALLPRQQMRMWFRGSNKWQAPHKPGTRVQNTITWLEALLCTASPNCCLSSALCRQPITTRLQFPTGVGGVMNYLAMRVQMFDTQRYAHHQTIYNILFG